MYVLMQCVTYTEKCVYVKCVMATRLTSTTDKQIIETSLGHQKAHPHENDALFLPM